MEHLPHQGHARAFVGIIDNAPDEQTAIEKAIEEYQVPPLSVHPLL